MTGAKRKKEVWRDPERKQNRLRMQRVRAAQLEIDQAANERLVQPQMVKAAGIMEQLKDFR